MAWGSVNVGGIQREQNNTTYDVFVGATEDEDGESGLVPKPYGDQDETRFLCGSGGWVDPAPIVNGLTLKHNMYRSNYGVCSTAATTAAKTVSCLGFVLRTGAEITVRFTYTNTASSPTLNVNSTGARAIYYHNAVVPANYLAANATYTFRYTGARWEIAENLPLAVTKYDFTNLAYTNKIFTTGYTIPTKEGYTLVGTHIVPLTSPSGTFVSYSVVMRQSAGTFYVPGPNGNASYVYDFTLYFIWAETDMIETQTLTAVS